MKLVCFILGHQWKLVQSNVRELGVSYLCLICLRCGKETPPRHLMEPRLKELMQDRQEGVNG